MPGQVEALEGRSVPQKRADTGAGRLGVTWANRATSTRRRACLAKLWFHRRRKPGGGGGVSNFRLWLVDLRGRPGHQGDRAEPTCQRSRASCRQGGGTALVGTGRQGPRALQCGGGGHQSFRNPNDGTQRASKRPRRRLAHLRPLSRLLGLLDGPLGTLPSETSLAN
uniref:Uncharacterized protein n=1 Tax=Trichuris muris TaxID=70415 RepID=A0A5S6Q8G5_TRIMR